MFRSSHGYREPESDSNELFWFITLDPSDYLATFEWSRDLSELNVA